MKRLSLVLLITAVLFGFSRCKKPNAPVFDGYGFQQSINVDITDGGGNEKGVWEPTATSTLRYHWNENDVVYVYCLDASNNGLGLAGTLHTSASKITQDANDKWRASFYGDVMIKYGTKNIRFIHYGSGIDVSHVDENEGVTVDLSLQNGGISGVGSLSEKTIASYEATYSTNGKYNNCQLKLEYAIAYLSFEEFVEKSASLSGISANQIHVDKLGNITKTSNSVSRDGAVTTLNDISSAYYLALVAEDEAENHVFSDGTVTSTVNKQFKINSFYSDGGFPAKLKSDVSFAYKKFSVAADKQVYFTKGNLYWDGDSFEFEVTQDAYASNNPVINTHVGHFYFHPWSRVAKSYSLTAYDATGQTTSDVLFTNRQDKSKMDAPNPEFEVAGVKGKYRALTNSEITYLKSTRTNAGNLWGYAVKTENPNKDHLYLVICPDDFTAPSGVTFKKSEQTDLSQDPTTQSYCNSYTNEQFAAMETAGAVFLPAGDVRKATNFQGFTKGGLYALADPHNSEPGWFLAFAFGFRSSGQGSFEYHDRQYGYQVRLVFDAVVNDGNTNDYGDGGDVNW